MCCSWTSCTRGIFHKFAPGWSEQDGQGDGQNGWSRRVSRQSKPNYQVPRTLFSVLRPFRLILVGLGSDRIVLSFVFIFQVIIYFTIFLSFKCKYIHQSIRNLSLFISRLTICFIQHGDKLKLKFCCKLRPFQFFFSWIFFIQVEIYGNAYAELCCVDY